MVHLVDWPVDFSVNISVDFLVPVSVEGLSVEGLSVGFQLVGKT